MGTTEQKRPPKTPKSVRVVRTKTAGKVAVAVTVAVSTVLVAYATRGDKPLAIPGAPPSPPAAAPAPATPPGSSTPRPGSLMPSPTSAISTSAPAGATSSAPVPAPRPATAAPPPVSPPTASTENRQPYEVSANGFRARGQSVWPASGPPRLNGELQGPQVSCSEKMLFQARDAFKHLVSSIERGCDYEKWPSYTPIYLPSSPTIVQVDIVLMINGHSAGRVICWRYANCKTAGTP